MSDPALAIVGVRVGSSPNVPSWRLDDAAAIAAANPFTFYKPSAEAIALLGAGNLVKLIFAFDSDDPKAPRAERMWVRIEQVAGDRYSGKLDNDPRYIKDLKCGDSLEFEARHVIQTDISDPVPDPTKPYWAKCFVTHRVLYDGVRVGYLYRESPEGKDDSGWRMTAGDESDDYMNNPDNSAFVALGAVLREDASIVEFLRLRRLVRSSETAITDNSKRLILPNQSDCGESPLRVILSHSND